MMEPLVSIIMPSLNNHSYIYTAINSIIKQNYSNWELILIDDGSTSPLTNIVDVFQEPKIRLFRYESNRGIPVSLNSGISFCKGEYIARFDSDDIFLPNRLNFQVAFMEKNLDVGVLGCAAIEFSGGKEKIIGTDFIGTDLSRYLMVKNFLIHPTVIIRKKIIDKYGVFYREDLVNAEDYEYWSRLSKYSKIANLPEVVIKYRVHPESQSRLGKFDQLRISLEVQKGILTENRFKEKDFLNTMRGYYSYYRKLFYMHSYKSKLLRTLIDKLNKSSL